MTTHSKADRTPLLGLLAARLPWWTRRGEVIATAALEQLLQVPALNDAFAALVQSRTGVSFGDRLDWHAEAIQDDRARPDLEGRVITRDGVPVPAVKVEAKLHAWFGDAQLEAYWDDMARRTAAGLPSVLMVVVPPARLHSARALVAALPPGPAVRHGLAFSWDELLDALEAAASAAVSDDVAQLRAMCNALGVLAVEPFMETDVEDGWRTRRPQLLDLATLATRQLIGDRRLNPIRDERTGYRHRYIGSAGSPNLSLGAIDPLPEAPGAALVGRFHCDTSGFSGLKARLACGHAPFLRPVRRVKSEREDQPLWFERDGHIWIPFEVPLHIESEEVVEKIRTQLQRLVDWAGVVP